ncbi:MAG: crossover junction endodeoxyribonuclease RuvC [Gammaproteobacteria bacterium]
MKIQQEGCILGVDPGSRITGFGLIQYSGRQFQYLASGCIELKNYGWPERLKIIHDGISLLLEKYNPNMAAIERIFVYKNPQTAIKLGQARGAALAAIAAKNLNLAEYAPRQIKQALVGFGGASKEQIQHSIKALLKLSKLPPSDAADALAIAICHLNRTVTVQPGSNCSPVGAGLRVSPI